MYRIKLINNAHDINNLAINNNSAVGFILSGNQKHRILTEFCRELSFQIPPLVSKLGFLTNEPKYVLQEIISFCKLENIVITSDLTRDDLGIPVIRQINRQELENTQFEFFDKFQGIFFYADNGQDFLKALPILEKLNKVLPIIIQEEYLSFFDDPYAIVCY